MPEYLTVTCLLAAQAEQELAAALEGWPALGCQVEDGGHDVRVTVYLRAPAVAGMEQVRNGLLALGGRDVACAAFAEQDWLAAYRRSVTPLAIGRRFWVDPSPMSPTPPPAGRIHLVVEPRQAFGTGSHESTRLVLELLEDLTISGRRVLDVGTGSGILALAAVALGARTATGFDIDLEAVFVARQTVAAQPRPTRAALWAGGIEAMHQAARFDLVLANLLPAQWGPMLPCLAAALVADGELVLSGLMTSQRRAVEEDLRVVDLCCVAAREAGEWAALVCRRR